MPVTLTIGPHIYGRLNSVFYVKVKTFHLMLLPLEVTINSTRIKLPPEKVMFFTLRLSKTEAGRKRIRNILFCFCKHAKLNSCTCRDIHWVRWECFHGWRWNPFVSVSFMNCRFTEIWFVALICVWYPHRWNNKSANGVTCVTNWRNTLWWFEDI